MELYNDNPVVSHTLSEFNARASGLHAEDQPNDAFIRFVLTGEYVDDDGDVKQAFLDPMQNAAEQDHNLFVMRDYDSLLGIADNILVDAPMAVYAVPHATFALRKSIHLQRPIMNNGVYTHVDYHKIPNFEFARFGSRHHINIFFPGLWSSERSKNSQPHLLSERERSFWYIHGMRRAIVLLLGENVAAEWPATYLTERIRATNRSGSISWGTKTIPKEAVGQLAYTIRHELRDNVFLDQADVAWASDFFILHTIRGVKHSSYHRMNAASAEFYLNELITDAQLSNQVPEEGDWYIDVGIQISSDDDACLQWMTSGHKTVVQQALRISDAHAARISDINSSKYTRDSASHLTTISGFRVVPGVQAQGEFEASYVQAYTTDKAVVSNSDGAHHAKFLHMKEAMGPEQPAKVIEGLYTIYEEAQRANSSSARLEVRVPYKFATEALMQLDPDMIRQCLCSFTRREWWGFRLIRLLAISQTLSHQATGRSSLRLLPDTLVLTAACVWLMNGLHARPEDGPAARRLMDAVLPVAEAEGLSRDILAYNTAVGPGAQQEEEEESDDDEDAARVKVPCNPYGCVFLRRMVIGDVPRLRVGGPVLSVPAFQYWFGMTIEAVKAKYVRTGIVNRATVAATRATTNKRKMPTYVNWTGAPEPNLFDNLDARGHSLPPPLVDEDGSDIEDRMSPPPAGPPPTSNEFLSQLWRQFVVDVTSKSPNPRGITNPSYIKLTDVQRLEGKEDIYKTVYLAEVFRAVAYRNASSADWHRAFHWLFPSPGYKTTDSVQNYPSCKYFQDWMAFVDEPRNKKLAKAMQFELWKRLRMWSWIPDAHQDKMWATKVLPGFTRWPAQKGPAPRILLRSTAVPVFDADEGIDGGEIDE